MVTINMRIIQGENATVIRGLEFPNVIVQGRNEEEAKQEFRKSLDYFFKIRAKIEREKYPLTSREKTEQITMDFIENEQSP